ncbi:MAG TPA: prepilin peptidase [Anaerolineae bacterium]|nr:prepilin peptidase [Anaerolineae bacterium]
MALAYGLIGLLVGSFLNTVIDRAPERRSLLRPPSHCANCRRRLSFLELVPVLSYLVLRGRCRDCGARIPRRILWVEVASGLLFAFLWHTYGLSVRLATATVYSCLMLVILVIDLERRLVLNVIVLPAVGLALLAMPLEWVMVPRLSEYALLWSLLGAGKAGLSLAGLTVMSRISGGMFAFLMLLFVRVLAPRGMGAGDVKLAAFLGLITGLPGAIVAILGSFILGGIAAAVLLLARVANRKTPVPFAPFLVVATFPVMIYGDRLLRWYSGL